MANYMELYSRSPFTTQFIYFDVPEYKADQIFAEHGITPRFYEEWQKDGTPFVFIRCRVSRKDKHKFVAAMAELTKKMLLTGFDNYDEVATGFFNQITEELTNMSELAFSDIDVGEYERLKARVENLNLYLKYVEDHAPELMEQMNEHFEGMPGYEGVSE